MFLYWQVKCNWIIISYYKILLDGATSTLNQCLKSVFHFPSPLSCLCFPSPCGKLLGPSFEKIESMGSGSSEIRIFDLSGLYRSNQYFWNSKRWLSDLPRMSITWKKHLSRPSNHYNKEEDPFEQLPQKYGKMTQNLKQPVKVWAETLLNSGTLLQTP